MKTIKVFVSSLFNEMMLERDILHRQVSALIAEKLGKNAGITVLFVDLRWGIDSRSKKVGFEKSNYILEKCFEAIEDCDLFLGIIASEYGSIADQEVVRKFFDDDIGAESYTSLEIKYASQHISSDKMLFMMTEQSSEDHPATIELKKRISMNYKTCYYHKGVVEGRPFVSSQFISGITEMVCVSAKLPKFDEKAPSGQWFARKHAIESCMSTVGKKTLSS